MKTLIFIVLILLSIKVSAQIRLKDGDTNYLSIHAPANLAADRVYTFPDAPVNSQFLTTDASGNLSWALPVGDDLGDHTATQIFDMGNFNITNANLIYATRLIANDFTTVQAGLWNISIGDNNLNSATSGRDNVAIGQWSMNGLTTGRYNIALGVRSLQSISTPNSNIGIGVDALTNATTGGYNIAIGQDTLKATDTESHNLAIGYQAMTLANGGVQSVAIGNYALDAITTSSSNVAIGYSAGTDATTGGSNVFVGASSGHETTTGSSNSFIGRNSGYNNTTGGSNTFLGNSAGYSNTTNGFNTFLGANAGYNSTGFESTMVGASAGYNNTIGLRNTYMGQRAGYKNATSNLNVGIGEDALEFFAPVGNAYNVAIGAYALEGVDGSSTGTWNTAIGGQAGRSITTGIGNILLGYNTDVPTATTSYHINIGNTIYGDILNTYVGIGNASPNDALDVTGDIDATGCVQTGDTGSIGGTCVSDRRFKTNIEPIENALKKVSSLQPVQYFWRPEFSKTHKREGHEIGLIAQEVEEVFPELVKTNEEGFKKIKYDITLQMYLIGAVKELSQENQILRQELQKIKKQIGFQKD